MRNIKNILNVFLSVAILGVFVISCAKDKGDYSYHAINSLQLSTDMSNVDPNVFITPDSIDLRQNDSLTVKLKIAESLGSSKNFSYQWMITQYQQSNANPPAFVIGNGESLRTKITLVPNLYRLLAKVTENGTGVSYYKSFALNVSGAEYGGEGWLVLQDQGDGADISVITTRDGTEKGKVFNDVYASINGRKLPKDTYKVNVVNYATGLRAQKVSFFYPNGGLQVRSIDFADSTKAENWFAGSPASLNLQVNGSAGGSATGFEYVIVNNQIAYRQVGSAAQLLNSPLFFPPFEGLSIAPFVINAATSDQIYTLYDRLNKGFVLFNASSSVLSNVPDYKGTASNLNPVTGQGFDLKNMSDNLIYAENTQPINTSFAIYWNCFFRNDAGTKTYLVQFPRGLTYTNSFTTGRFQLNEANCPGINSATLFANPTTLPMPGGVFYYVNGAKIFTCTLNPLAGSTATPGLTFPPGTVIKAMKVFNSGYTTANIASLNIPEGKVMAVATDETINGEGNKVYFFNLNAQTGAIIGTPNNPVNVYTGFEKIIDITFKKALGR